ncbi:CRISPR-associated protein Cst2 [Caldanaerobius fijiensis DSM 17918]|uniref:CRISPR-associated protein Cst2 n=1 Tax=Caldanaerobius fijiensis DSM 17918 TaxID=1121256 RepID=A0A1M4SKM6_9THEO|nr:type I-B CRISPR-associated protein Cas7/Cst2/DevR [Caldanaerobius fijiensis]SHE32761.1 CRISPR-associated protein Cst2 [Caldanaerobius fijiensis DSM 17918]
MDMKCIEMTWLSKTSLTNLNSGEGESNLIDVKKYKWKGEEYPYVSGQAMRFYMKEAIRRLTDFSSSCIPNDKGESCGDVSSCELCDLFGYMSTIEKKESKKGGAKIRVSPVKVAPAMGLLPFDENSTIDFLTRKKRSSTDSGDLKGDIVNVEMGLNIYRSGISIDVYKIGREEVINEDNGRRTIELKDLVPADERLKRIIHVLDAVKNMSDYSKQARLLTDFTPDFILCSLQPNYNHRLQKAIEIDERQNLNTDRLKEILIQLKEDGSYIVAGAISGIVNNLDEVKEVLSELGIELKLPGEAINALKEKIR